MNTSNDKRKNFTLDDKSINRIINNYAEYYHYYYDLIYNKRSKNKKELFLFSFITLIYFRSIGFDGFANSDNMLLKFANEKKWQDFALIISDFYDYTSKEFNMYAKSKKNTPFISLYKTGFQLGSMKMSKAIREYKFSYYENHKPKARFKDKHEIINSRKNAMDGMDIL